MPFISVIVPIYNAEKTLHRCVDSILTQTFTNFELLLINDGSKDRSGEICDEYAKKDSRVRVFHKEDGGVSSARNVGLDNMTGEWLTFVDADDYIGNLFLFNTLKFSNADLIINNAIVIKECGYTDLNDIPSGYHQNKKLIISQHLNSILLMSPWAKLFRHSLIGDLRFNEKMRLAEDALFVYQYLHKTTSIFVTPEKAAEKSYLYEYPAIGLSCKYNLSVKEAVYGLIEINNAYEQLNICCPNIEVDLPRSFYRYCLSDIKAHGKYWFRDPQIKKICIRKSRYHHILTRIIMIFVFVPILNYFIILLRIHIFIK